MRNTILLIMIAVMTPTVIRKMTMVIMKVITTNTRFMTMFMVTTMIAMTIQATFD